MAKEHTSQKGRKEIQKKRKKMLKKRSKQKGSGRKRDFGPDGGFGQSHEF